MTSFYMFRLWFKTFFGAQRFDEDHLGDDASAKHAGSGQGSTMKAEHDEGQAQHSHGVHESPWLMLLPLVVLAILSVVGGWVGVPAALGGHNEFEHFLDPVFAVSGQAQNLLNADQISHGLERALAAISLLTAVAGFLVAWLLYYRRPGIATALAAKAKPLYALVMNKFYVDEIYHAVFVTGLLGFTRVFLYGLADSIGVDGAGKLASWMAVDMGEAARRMQSGNLRSYAGWLALGAAVVMAVMIFGRGMWMHG